ncbi:MAG: hypothetical protein ABIH46_14000, partial [Chloroflexota bacterium]
MSEQFVMSHVRPEHNYIVAGPHWSWGCGYTTIEQADHVLDRNRIAFGYTRCQICRRFVAGLHEQP